MNQESSKKTILEIATAIKATIRDFKSIRGIGGFFSASPAIVRRIEDLSKTIDMSGEEKKYMAVEVMLELIPLPPWLPRPIARFIIGYAIERAVAEMNKILKKN